jgi:hypothetical protein
MHAIDMERLTSSLQARVRRRIKRQNWGMIITSSVLGAVLGTLLALGMK